MSDDEEREPCSRCKGEGWITVDDGYTDHPYGDTTAREYHTTEEDCPDCDGTGFEDEEE